MLRWTLVTLVVLLTGLALWGTSRLPSATDQRDGIADEILAYEVTAEQSVEVELQAGLEQVLVTAWAVVPPEPEHQPATAYAFGVEARLTSAQGQPVGVESYQTLSRVSRDPTAPTATRRFGARLAYSREWLTDARTFHVATRPIAARGGRLRLRALPGTPYRVLLRVSYEEPRSLLEQRLLATRLTPLERRELVDRRFSLGFADLEPEARARALAFGQRRLIALGRGGTEYVQRRVLLGSEPPAPLPDAAPPPWVVEIGPERAAALNVGGPIELRVHAGPGAELALRDGHEPLRLLRADEAGDVVVRSAGTLPRTLAIEATRLVQARFSLTPEAAAALIGQPRLRPAAAGRLELAPEIRLVRYARLAWHEPVRVHRAPGQTLVGVTVRGTLSGAAPSVAAPGRLQARWVDGRGRVQHATFTPELAASRFDVWFTARAPAPELATQRAAGWLTGELTTESHSTMWRWPEAVTQLELYGDPTLFVNLWTDEPDVEESVLESSYQLTLAEDQHWRHAPYAVKAWAPILPDNDAELDTASRVLQLAGQVRLETRAPPSVPLPERSIAPEGQPLRRELLTRELLPFGAALPQSGWTVLGAPTELRVDAAALARGGLELVYRAEGARLGEPLQVLVDGSVAHDEPLIVRSGRVRLELPPGNHRVAVDGLGADGMALVRAAPARGGAIVRSHGVFELTTRQPLDFVIEQRRGERLTLLLFVVTEPGTRDFSLLYDVDGGQPRLQRGAFYRRATTPSGALTGVAGSDAAGRLWELERPGLGAGSFPDGVARAAVVLGDDLEPGRHRVRIRRGPAQRGGIWLRAVLVGQSGATSDDATRLWIAEQ